MPLARHKKLYTTLQAWYVMVVSLQPAPSSPRSSCIEAAWHAAPISPTGHESQQLQLRVWLQLRVSHRRQTPLLIKEDVVNL
jgi:hypothetical protein